MKATVPYEIQRQTLRLRLQANRLQLTRIDSGAGLANADAYPRSLTMRLLTRTPGIATFILAELAPFLLGRYLASARKQSEQ